MENNMIVYLAAPFFTPEQLELVERIEDTLRQHKKIEVYSPRSDGVLMNMTAEEKAVMAQKIFNTNCQKIDDADMVLAVVDGRDTGTIWELGFAYAIKRFFGDIRIVTYTNHNYGLNVMIQKSVDAHIHGLANLEIFFRDIFVTGNDEVYDRYKNFNVNIT